MSENKLSDNYDLTDKQQRAYSLMCDNKNVFITGPGGTGKSSVIKMFYNNYKDTKNIVVTSTTGISALQIGGVTLHSYLGIRLGKESAEYLTKRILSSTFYTSRWRKLQTLIIDEVSMLSPELFDKLEQIARDVRRTRNKRVLNGQDADELPFGGIQLILSGDFLQLPVVGSQNFCFESESWKKCITHEIELTEIMRQNDSQFQELLNNIRYGNCTSEVKQLLQQRVNIELTNELGIKPTRIYTTNRDVDVINEQELDNLARDNDVQFYEYELDIVIYKFIKDINTLTDKLRKNCIAKDHLQLCVGAQVMLVANLAVDLGLANGSRGVVIGFVGDKNLPVVRFLNGHEQIIDYHQWKYEQNDEKIAGVWQIPLTLAWSNTVHKCVTKDTLICTPNGLKRIGDLSPKNQQNNTTISINQPVLGKHGINIASKIYKGYNEITYTITTLRGYTITGSCRHPLLIYNNGIEKWVKLPDIKKGDTLVLKNNLNCFGTNVSTHSFVANNCVLSYKIPEYVNSELCYLIGLLIGDGCYSTQRSYPIEFCGHKKEIHIKTIFKKYMYNCFGINVKDYTNDKKSTFKLMTNSKFIRTFFLWCGLDYVTSKNKRVPWVVLESNRDCQIACLKGLFDTDGGVSNLIHYTTISKQLAIDISMMLLNLGIMCSLRKLNGESRKNLKQAYRIQICGYDAHLFYKMIGFETPHKQAKLAKKYGTYSLNTIKSNENEIPNGKKLITNLRDELSLFTKEHSIDALSRTHGIFDVSILALRCSTIITNRTKLRYNTLRFICETVSEYFTPIQYLGESGKQLYDIYTKNLFFDKVDTIEIGEKQVLYDIEVPEDHTFIGNGIVNHNSQSLTLDYVEIDLGNVFEFGQAYVALSRVKTLEGMKILNLDFNAIRAHPKAIEYYKNISER